MYAVIYTDGYPDIHIHIVGRTQTFGDRDGRRKRDKGRKTETDRGRDRQRQIERRKYKEMETETERETGSTERERDRETGSIGSDDEGLTISFLLPSLG